MSREEVTKVIGRAMLDERFRAAVFANPDEAFAAYDLTEEEVAALKAIDSETIEGMAGTLDERVSKMDWAGVLLFGGDTAGDSSNLYKV
jgi:hypothetical protein